MEDVFLERITIVDQDKEQQEEQGCAVLAAMMLGEKEGLLALEKLSEKMSQRDLAACLAEAINRNMEELFVRLLDMGGQREYSWILDDIMMGNGNLLVHAAVRNRVSFAKILLERGYDCNGAVGMLAKERMSTWGSFGQETVRRYCGSSENVLFVHNPRLGDHMVRVSHITPLAAALVCGSAEVAALLLSEQGIWKGESTAVCRAAVLALEGYQICEKGMTRKLSRTKECREAWKELRERQKEVIRMIFCPEREKLPSANKLFRSIYLQPACFVDFCSLYNLQLQLKSGLCSERDVEEIVCVMKNTYPPEFLQALVYQTLWESCPQFCQENWVAGYFLKALLQMREEAWWDMLLPIWRKAAGTERDLTWGMNYLLQRCRTVKEIRPLLRELGKGGTLVLDSRHVLWSGTTPAVVAEVIRNVRIRFWENGDIGNLTNYLISRGDLRLLKLAGEKGILAHEDPKTIFREMDRNGEDRTDHRAAVLIYARGEELRDEYRSDWREMEKWCGPFAEPFHDERDSAAEQLSQLLQNRIPKEECLRKLYDIGRYTWFQLRESVRHPLIEWNDTGTILQLACLAEHGNLMKALLEHRPEMLREELRGGICCKREKSMFFERKQHCFQGTALVLASIFGRTEQIKLLLEQRENAVGPENGRISVLCINDKPGNEVFLTPLTAAILFGNEKAARVLMEAGEICDYSCPLHFETLHAATNETVELIERLGNTGWEKLAEEQRKNVCGMARNNW